METELARTSGVLVELCGIAHSTRYVRQVDPARSLRVSSARALLVLDSSGRIGVALW